MSSNSISSEKPSTSFSNQIASDIFHFPTTHNEASQVILAPLRGLKRRWQRERRRRAVSRAYDMALEIAQIIPRRAEVLDVGCGNGFIAHHLSALLETPVMGIDLSRSCRAPIRYEQYDGSWFPSADNSLDAVLLCYVLHHAQDIQVLLGEMARTLRQGGLAVVYEDMPVTRFDEGVCWCHNLQWRGRTGQCSFRNSAEWSRLFQSFGFVELYSRRLSRWRNLAHPVSRRLFVLQLKEQARTSTPCAVSFDRFRAHPANYRNLPSLSRDRQSSPVLVFPEQ